MYMKRHYWFKPARFWGIFAAYYPATQEGWLITASALGALIASFIWADARAHSASDTLISFAAPAIVILVIFDLISFRTGEYPHWWKKWGKR